MASKNIGRQKGRLRASGKHISGGDESFSETVDRILHELDSDWRTNVGFLSDEEADSLEAEVTGDSEATDDALTDLGGKDIDERFSEDS
ncbi:MAG: hypothetical protein U5K37_01840 [Natrialbaceae archaeon]|nr:hypothetical protein [Natrialbaceae archaeon]